MVPHKEHSGQRAIGLRPRVYHSSRECLESKSRKVGQGGRYSYDACSDQPSDDGQPLDDRHLHRDRLAIERKSIKIIHEAQFGVVRKERKR